MGSILLDFAECHGRKPVDECDYQYIGGADSLSSKNALILPAECHGRKTVDSMADVFTLSEFNFDCTLIYTQYSLN